MTISFTDIVIAGALSLASGRVAYSITRDGIFRRFREWVWLYSPGEGAMVQLRGEDGDREVPARMMHYSYTDSGSDAYAFQPTLPPRDPGFFGSLVECPYCVSFWTSLVAAGAWLVLGDNVIYPALPLAIWAAANTYATKGL